MYGQTGSGKTSLLEFLIHVCIYGQTGSGKTHTMGTAHLRYAIRGLYGASKSLISRTTRALRDASKSPISRTKRALHHRKQTCSHLLPNPKPSCGRPEEHDDLGIIPRAVKQMFDEIQARKDADPVGIVSWHILYIGGYCILLYITIYCILVGC